MNGVTLDGSEDRLDASLNNFLKDFYGGNTPGVRRRSWAPNSTTTQTIDNLHHEDSAPLSAKRFSLLHCIFKTANIADTVKGQIFMVVLISLCSWATIFPLN